MKNLKNNDHHIEFPWHYVIGAVIIVTIFGLLMNKNKKNISTEIPLDTPGLENLITQSKSEKQLIPEQKPQGKIIPPASPYEIENLRQSLNLPAEEEKDTRNRHEEVLKKDPQAKFIF